MRAPSVTTASWTVHVVLASPARPRAGRAARSGRSSASPRAAPRRAPPGAVRCSVVIVVSRVSGGAENMMRRPVLWKWKLAKMFGCFNWNSNTLRVSVSDIGYGQPSSRIQPYGKLRFGSGPPMSSSLMRPSPSLSKPSAPRRRKRGDGSLASATPDEAPAVGRQLEVARRVLDRTSSTARRRRPRPRSGPRRTGRRRRCPPAGTAPAGCSRCSGTARRSRWRPR